MDSTPLYDLYVSTEAERVETLDRAGLDGTILASALLRNGHSGYCIGVLTAFFRSLFSPGTESHHLETQHFRDLQSRVELLERSEVVRSAEHADMLDRFDRLYRRLSARIHREHTKTPPDDRSSVVEHPEGTESTLSLRQRLQRR